MRRCNALLQTFTPKGRAHVWNVYSVFCDNGRIGPWHIQQTGRPFTRIT